MDRDESLVSTVLIECLALDSERRHKKMSAEQVQTRLAPALSSLITPHMHRVSHKLKATNHTPDDELSAMCASDNAEQLRHVRVLTVENQNKMMQSCSSEVLMCGIVRGTFSLRELPMQEFAMSPVHRLYDWFLEWRETDLVQQYTLRVQLFAEHCLLRDSQVYDIVEMHPSQVVCEAICNWVYERNMLCKFLLHALLLRKHVSFDFVAHFYSMIEFLIVPDGKYKQKTVQMIIDQRKKESPLHFEKIEKMLK